MRIESFLKSTDIPLGIKKPENLELSGSFYSILEQLFAGPILILINLIARDLI